MDVVGDEVVKALDAIQTNLLERARAARDSKLVKVRPIDLHHTVGFSATHLPSRAQLYYRAV